MTEDMVECDRCGAMMALLDSHDFRNDDRDQCAYVDMGLVCVDCCPECNRQTARLSTERMADGIFKFVGSDSSVPEGGSDTVRPVSGTATPEVRPLSDPPSQPTTEKGNQ